MKGKYGNGLLNFAGIKHGAPISSIAACMLLLAGVPSPENVQVQQLDDPSAIVMERCTVCHTTERICNNLSKKDTEEWTRTIETMVSRGADVASEDIRALAEYLANLEPGSQPVCR